MIEIILFLITVILVNFFLKTKKILLNNSGQLHQGFTNEKMIPLSGGIFIMLYFFYIFFSVDLKLLSFLLIFFSLGLCGDLNLIKSPTKRFFLQLLFLLFFIITININIFDVRVEWINQLLTNYYVNIFFILFCFLVLINGSNFIDGNNGLSIGYYLIIFLLIYYLVNQNIIIYDLSSIEKFIFVLTVLLLFNLANKNYLGDSGIYILSIYTGYTLIQIYTSNQTISPYLIANYLWYPSFEILFSIIRKAKYKYSPMKPDTSHLHQLLFLNFCKKLRTDKVYINSLTGVIINIYNFLILFVATLNPFNTQFQIYIIILSVVVYIFCYFTLLRIKKLSKK